MILDLDIGNTRVKWLLRADDGSSCQAGASEFDRFFDEPHPVLRLAPARVRASSVRGDDARRRVEARVRELCGVGTEFAHSTRSAAGVTNGYDLPERLGVDRWLGMLAAFARVRDAVLVIDCGSALTADLVDDSGLHLGGFIAPGSGLMRRSLRAGTAGVRFEDAGERFSFKPGRDTAATVCAGVSIACAGFVHMAWESAREHCGNFATIVTGGDAEVLLPRLQINAYHCPSLVLDGLAIALP